MAIFNEETLRNAIYEQWGKFGVHAEIFDRIVAENKKLWAEHIDINPDADTVIVIQYDKKGEVIQKSDIQLPLTPNP